MTFFGDISFTNEPVRMSEKVLHMVKRSRELYTFHQLTPSRIINVIVSENTSHYHWSFHSLLKFNFTNICPVPNEIMNDGKFIIRHTAACNFSEYDPDAIPFLGHLPQDLTGNSIFDCYHPEDLPLMLSIYQQSE